MEDCYTLDTWSDAAKVSQRLGRPVAQAKHEALGSQMSGAATRSFSVWFEGTDVNGPADANLVLKIGNHTGQHLGRNREATFYNNFAAKGGSNSNNNAAAAQDDSKNPLAALRPSVPACWFAASKVDENGDEHICVVIERIAGVDSGLFFLRHSPHNWKFANDEEIAPLITKWTSKGIDQKAVSIEAARLAARLHGPFLGFQTNKKNSNTDSGDAPAAIPAILNDPLLADAACRDWFIAALNNNDDQTAPASWEASRDFALKGYLAELKKDDVASGRILPFGFKSKLVADCLAASVEKTTWKNYAEMIRTNPATLVHGDFHPGNAMVRDIDENGKPIGTNGGILCLVDFEMHRFGWGPQELGQWLISHARPQARRDMTDAMLEAYCTTLKTEFGHKDLDVEWVRREFAQGGAGRWLWFLPVLASLCPAELMVYFHDQVEAFLVDEKITPENVPMMRC